MAEILLCAGAAALLLGLVWLLLARLLLPIQTKNVYVVLAARADGETLEHDCRAWLLLKNLGVFRRPLLLVDEGLNEEGYALAERLLQLDASIRFCSEEALHSALAEEQN